jgi:hypothetical protein
MFDELPNVQIPVTPEITQELKNLRYTSASSPLRNQHNDIADAFAYLANFTPPTEPLNPPITIIGFDPSEENTFNVVPRKNEYT